MKRLICWATGAVLAVSLLLGGLVSLPAAPPDEIPPPDDFPRDDRPKPETHEWYAKLKDKTPYLEIGYNPDTQRFGLLCIKQPDPQDPKKFKRLTSTEKGDNNNTCIRIDGSDYLVGATTGVMPKGYPRHSREPERWITKWTCANQKRITVTQELMLVPGQSGLLDTCLVHYIVENRGDVPRTVGLRVMLDTQIGSNDGVPFSVPGHKPPLVEDLAEIRKLEVPDYLEALETGDPLAPGTIAHLGLKGFYLPEVEQLEPLNYVVLCRWPVEQGGGEVRWDWKYEKINENPDKKDSCVVLYWFYVRMNPGEVRHMAYTYGLGTFSGQKGEPANPQTPQVAMSAPAGVRKQDEFTVTGYVKHPQDGVKVELALPEGLKLLSDKAQEIKLKRGDPYGQVSWRLKAEKNGNYHLELSHGEAKVSRDVSVSADRNLFE